MKKSTALLLGLAGAAVLAGAGAAVLLAPGKASKSQKKPFVGRNFAHRGLHSEDRSVAENSLPAFDKAASAGYGIELDVQLSKDGQVVVFHDDDLKRVCGDERRVDQVDYAELKEMRLCQTEETVPLFSTVLEIVNGRSPLIVELKTGRHNDELCRKTCEALADYKGSYCIESFDPRIVAWFRKNAPGILRGQLAAPASEYKNKKPLPFLLSHVLLNVIARPQFIAYKIGPRPLAVRLSELLGAMKVGWTSKDRSSEKGRDAVIFEFYTPEVFYK